VPNFEWDLGPIALELPKGPLLMVVGAIAVLMLVVGLAKKQTDLAVFGLFMGAILLFASDYLPDPIGLRYYSLLFVGVFLGGYALLNWQITRGGGDEETAGDFIVYGVLGVLVGARLGHVIFYDLDHAMEDPLWVFEIWTGGLASHGAVIGLIIAMWLFTKNRGIPFLEGADRFAFSAALGATLVRLGNFFNSEIVGKKVPDQSWGVRFPRYDHTMADPPLRYPTQLYEVALGLFVMATLYAVDRAKGQEKRPRGLLISTFFLVYFTGRFLVEFYKEFQSAAESGPLTMGQYLSMPGIVIGIVGVIATLKNPVPAGWPRQASAESEDEGESSEDEEDEDEDGDSAKGKLYDPDVDAELSGESTEEEEEPSAEDAPKEGKDEALEQAPDSEKKKD
jgi:phosphatidylglycerol:prolipoprotein diacylglycerol transferase